MKFGICGNMIASDLRNGGVEVAPVLAQLGYDYIELSLSDLAQLSDSEFQSVIRLMETSGIPCECCNNFFPPALKLTGPEMNLPKILGYAGKALQRAAGLGANIVVFGSGPAKNVPGNFPREKAWEQLILICRKLDPLAGSNNLTIALEPLRKEECNIVNSAKEAIDLMRDSGTKNIKILVDFYHLSCENEPPEILFDAGPDLKHVHFANPTGRIFPKSWEENLNYRNFFGNLMKIDYNGNVSIEAFSQHLFEDAKASILFANEIKQLWNENKT